jgi:type IV secretory pathway VirJ component
MYAIILLESDARCITLWSEGNLWEQFGTFLQKEWSVMKKIVLYFLLSFLTQLLMAKEETLSFEPFGKISLYYQSVSPGNVALFVSGDGGWNQGVVDMARELASLDALVVGIDINHFLKAKEASGEKCLYPAADFEALSKFVQKKLSYPVYRTPILIGYSSGATLIYAALVQAPSNTFLGGISLGFCPDLMLRKAMCRGSGLEWTAGPKGKGYNFLPASSLEVPWIALQGTIDQVCDPKSTESFVKKVPQAEVIILPKVGHGFSVPKNWMPQFRKAFSSIAARAAKEAAVSTTASAKGSPSLPELPLVEVPATAGNVRLMGVIITGDGGWGVTDRGIARDLSARGIPVVGLNSLHYFWTRKTPEQTATDVSRILQHYSIRWNRPEVVFIGYSFGADVLPFILNRLPGEDLQKIKVIAFLGLSSTADFQFHLTDWFSNRRSPTAQLVRPEVEKLYGRKILCFYGTDDDDALCGKLDPRLVKAIPIEGGHRFGRGFQPIVDAIFQAIAP